MHNCSCTCPGFVNLLIKVDPSFFLSGQNTMNTVKFSVQARIIWGLCVIIPLHTNGQLVGRFLLPNSLVKWCQSGAATKTILRILSDSFWYVKSCVLKRRKWPWRYHIYGIEPAPPSWEIWSEVRIKRKNHVILLKATWSWIINSLE